MPKAKAGQAPSAPLAQRQLTRRQARFVEEYIRNGGNGTRAAIAAGCVPGTASVRATRWLAKANIRAAVDEERAAWADRCRVDRDRLLEELLVIALGDAGDFSEWDETGVTLVSSKKLGRKTRYVSEISESRMDTEYGKSVSTKIRFHDKKGAINDIWDKLGFGKEGGGRDRFALLEQLFGAARAKRGAGPGDKK